MKPETIVRKFFNGELKTADGSPIYVNGKPTGSRAKDWFDISDAATWEICNVLLSCLKRYKKI